MNNKKKQKKDSEQNTEGDQPPKKKISKFPPEIRNDPQLMAMWHKIEKQYQIKIIQILYLRNLPQPEQKSPAWFKMREEMISASDGATAVGADPYKKQYNIILKKCNLAEKYEDNINTYHGKKFENIARMKYEEDNNVRIIEYGLLKHSSISHLGASPDGICGYQTLDNKFCKLVGRLLEIKCPRTRVIKTEGEICPKYYYVQVQLQLECCNLEECDFMQCKITDYPNRQAYLDDQDPDNPFLSKTTHLEKGCLIQLMPIKEKCSCNTNMPNEYGCAKWLYPPKIHLTNAEYDKWIAEQISNLGSLTKYNNEYHGYIFDRVIYWKFDQVSCVLIKRDKDWFAEQTPIIKKIWDYILYFRINTRMKDLLDKYVKMCSHKTLENNGKIMNTIDKLFHAKENKTFINHLSSIPIHIVTDESEEDKKMGNIKTKKVKLINSDTSNHSKKKPFDYNTNMFVDHD
jgi:putative phage-type endonuclease